MGKTPFPQTERFILDVMRQKRIPGLTIAVVEEEETIFSKGYGFRSIGRGTPATPNTIFGIGSITKSFTALSLMKLVEEGKVRLDDSVSNYIPLNLKCKGKEVTIHHLLTHTSGIPSLTYAEALFEGFMGMGKNWLPITRAEDVLNLAEEVCEWAVEEPGRKFFYLNTGYVLLGEVVRSVSGMSFEEFVRKEVLNPLGMSNTSFYTASLTSNPMLADGYVMIQGELIRKSFPEGIGADGGLFSTVEDLTKYLRMFLNGGGDLVSEKSVKAMETSYAEVPWHLFGGEGYGYGLMVYPKFLGRKLVGHSGSVLIYTGFIGYVRDRGLGVAVLENSSLYPPSNIGMFALAEALGENPVESLPFIKKEITLRKVEGEYRSYRSLTKIRVRVEGDFLILERGEYMKQVLVPVEVTDEWVRCFTFSGGSRLEAVFKLNEGRTELIFERYRYIKN